MNILGIDYGRKKIGLAIADSDVPVAQPLTVIRVNSQKQAIENIEKVVKETMAEKIVIGISEGKMADETKEFAEKLEKMLKLTVDFQDESLSTINAQSMSIQANIKRKKRKRLEDAYSATLILEDYLAQQ